MCTLYTCERVSGVFIVCVKVSGVCVCMCEFHVCKNMS